MYLIDFNVEPATASGYFRRNFMKNLGKLATLGAVLVASTSFAFGSTILLASYGQAGLSGFDPVTGSSPNNLSNSSMQFVGSETYSTFALVPGTPGPLVGQGGTGFTTTGAGTAYELDPSSVWAAAPTPPASAYVGSTATSGPVGTVNPAYGYYEYQTTVAGLGFNYMGTLSVLADDTTEVLLSTSATGPFTTLIPFGSLGGDTHCATGQPNCVSIDTVGLSLLAGTDTLTFVVEQDGSPNGPGATGNPSGVAFDATLSSIPEPSSLMLLGSGLIGAAGMFFRRRVTA
jgi:hypothetical protein